MARQIPAYCSVIKAIMLWTVLTTAALALPSKSLKQDNNNISTAATTANFTSIEPNNRLPNQVELSTNERHQQQQQQQQQSTKVGDNGGGGSTSQPPSYAPVFYVFSLAALVCLAVTLHVLYNEWASKYNSNGPAGNSDELAMRTVDNNGNLNGNLNGSNSGSLIIGGDLIPMTLQGNGDLRLSASMQHHQHHQQSPHHLSRFDSIPLGTPHPYLPGALSKSQGMLAFEAVS